MASQPAITYNWQQTSITFIGAGKLVTAMLGGIIAAGLIPPHRIRVTNRSNQERLRQLAQEFGVATSTRKAEALEGADIIILAVKPGDAAAALAEMAGYFAPHSVIVSVMAGISLDYLFDHTQGHGNLVRAMPNTAARVRESATALCAHEACDPQALQLATELFQQIGGVVQIDETLFDAVTAVSGSGPAYLYLMLEAMTKAGIELGLPAGAARDLVIQTAIGAGAMLKATGSSPLELRQQVTSPGGTTAAAIQILQDGGFDKLVQKAVDGAARRAAELANPE